MRFAMPILVAAMVLAYGTTASGVPVGPECEICKVSPDFTTCGDHGVCVQGVCWQWCEAAFGEPACRAFSRGDYACHEDVCVFFGLEPCQVNPGPICF
jgi:hypothetical protein